MRPSFYKHPSPNIRNLFNIRPPFEVDNKTDDKNATVYEGDPIHLFCHVKAHRGNTNWKTCKWTRESDGPSCLYTYNKEEWAWNVTPLCSPIIKDSTFWTATLWEHEGKKGRNQFCGIFIPFALPDDNSKWRCELEQCKNFDCTTGNGNFAKATIDVQVIT